MFFGAPDEDDDDDFTPTSGGGSKLSSLFGGAGGGKSSNLKYVAPKQPRGDRSDSTGSGKTSADQSAANKQASAVLLAVPVHAYLYVNQNGQAQGRAMCCVLGDATEANFQLLVYRSKQDHLTRARITQHFSITVQPNFYANFTDDQQKSWSVLLEAAQYVDLLTQIGICRAVAGGGGGGGGGSESVIVAQDVGPGEGPGLKEGDQVQLNISTWSITTAAKLGELTEPGKTDQRVKLKDTEGNWKAGLVGAMKNSRRLIFTHKAGVGLVMHDVIITRVKQKGGGDGDISGRSTPLINSTPDSTTTTNISVSDPPPQESSAVPPSRPVPSSRSHLVNRMARVGHQLFPPSLASQQVQPTDSESEVEEITRRRGRGRSLSGESTTEELEATPAVLLQPPRPSHHHHHHQHHQPSTTTTPPPHHHHQHHPQQMVVYQPAYRQNPAAMAGYPPTAMAPQQPVAPPPPPAPAAPDPTLTLLFSETRTQNTELKISVARMSDKIDALVSKMEKMEQQKQQNQQQIAVSGQQMPGQMGLNYGHGGFGMMPQYPHPHPHAPMMAPSDPQALLTQVSSVVKENEVMRGKLEERDKRVAELNESVTQLLHKNQKLLEEKTNMLEAQGGGGGGGGEVAALREDRAKLTGQLSLTSHQLDTLKVELSQSKEKVEGKEREVEDLRAQLQTNQSDQTNRDTQLTQLREKLDDAERESEAAKRERDEARRETESARKEAQSARDEREETLREIERARTEGASGDQEILRAKEAENERLNKMVGDLKNVAKVLRSQLKETQEKQEGTANQEQEHKNKIAQEQVEILEAEKKQLEGRVRELEREIQHSGSGGGGGGDTVGAVKRVMNHVYKTLKPHFHPTEAYQGQEVMTQLLAVIKETTLNMMEEMEKNNSTPRGKPNNDAEQVNGRTEGENQPTSRSQAESTRANTSPAQNALVEQDQHDSQNGNKVTSPSLEQERRADDFGTVENSVIPTEKNTESRGNEFTNPTESSTLDDTATPKSNEENKITQSAEDKKATESSTSKTKEDARNEVANSTGNSKPTETSTPEMNEVAKNEVSHSTEDQNATESTTPEKKEVEISSVAESDPSNTNKGKSESSRDSSLERGWRPQPPTPPLFSDEEDDDSDWLS